MKTAAKRGLFLCVLAAGLALAVWLIAATIPRRFLYANLSAIGLREGVFLALTVLLWVAAAFCMTYVLYHAGWKLLRLLLPLVLGLVFLLLGAVLLRFTANRVLCSYTEDRAAFTGQYEETDPITAAENCYPKRSKGTLTGYRYYASGEAAGEEITLHFDSESFEKELQRLDALRLRRREGNVIYFYRSEQDGKMTVVQADPREQTVTYGRYLKNEEIPAFAPHA